MIIIILIILILYLTIFGKRYYLLANVLVRIIPYVFAILLIKLDLNKTIFIIVYFIYKLIINNLNLKKIPLIDKKFSDNFLIDSTKIIDIRILKPLNILNNQKYIFLYAPHAIYNQGFIYLFGNYKFRNNTKIIPLVHSYFKYIPLVSELFSCFGFMECTKSNINFLLDQNYSIALSAGGIQEIFKTKENEENIYIKKRESIFQISLNKKVKIVPILSIGESDWFTPPNFSQYLKGKYVRLVSYLLSWGKTYQPWLPKGDRLSLLFGDPIDFIDYNGNLKSIDQLKMNFIEQLKYLHHLSNLYNKSNRVINFY